SRPWNLSALMTIRRTRTPACRVVHASVTARARIPPNADALTPGFYVRVGCVYSIRSRRALVLVQESAKTVATLQRYRLPRRPRRRGRPTIRRCQVQAAMRPPTIVMIDEHRQRALQMPCEAIFSDTLDFRERVLVSHAQVSATRGEVDRGTGSAPVYAGERLFLAVTLQTDGRADARAASR